MLNQQEFPAILQKYFYQRLIQQKNCSEKTIQSYRDTFRLLLQFAEKILHKNPSNISLEDLNANFIIKFLNNLESERKNTIRSRNTRLAAIHSFFRYAAHQVPTTLPMIQQVLAIPMKKFYRPLVGFLTHEEIDAIIAAPDNSTWNGRRDHTFFVTLYNTGARISEMIALRCTDIELNRSPVVHLHGKGRKERVIPLWKNTASLLREWITQINQEFNQPLFPNQLGKFMTRSGAEDRLRSAVKIAEKSCPTLKTKKISPHIIRHTTAMHLLQSGVDLTVIALWLGHESTTATHHYVEADLKMKEKTLGSIQEPKNKKIRYRPSDKVLAFLDSL